MSSIARGLQHEHCDGKTPSERCERPRKEARARDAVRKFYTLLELLRFGFLQLQTLLARLERDEMA